MIRKGLGKGLGKGYKNLIPKDSYIHSLSAKGVQSIIQMPSLSKRNAFRLEVLQAITVPSTMFDKKISEREFMARIDEVQKWLSKNFGGETTISGKGGYVTKGNKLIEEDVVVITSFADDKDFEKKQEKLLNQIDKWKKEWNQESIAYQVEDDLYLI